MNKAKRQLARRSTGLVLIALVLLMGLAGVSPELHAALHDVSGCVDHCDDHRHEDSEDKEHVCGVTLLQTGAILLIDEPALTAIGYVCSSIEGAEVQAYPAAWRHLPQGRAPPIAGIV
jgi:hypothetical protein